MCNLFTPLEKLKPSVTEPNIRQCFYCGFVDEKVGASGVIFCPQRFCQGPGNFSGRWKSGYQDGNGVQTDKQFARMVADCKQAITEEQTDYRNLLPAMERSLGRMFL